MPADNELKWIRVPVQGRSQRTLQRLLDATERLLEHKPFDQVSVAEIAREAKASVGSFYARFDEKQALLHALHERYIREAEQTTESALNPDNWREVPLGEFLRALLMFQFQNQAARRGLRRALTLASATNDEIRKRNAELAGFTVEKILAVLESRREDVGHPDLLTAVEFLHRVVFGILDQALMYHDQSPTARSLPDDQLVDELVAMSMSYLKVNVQ